MGEGSNDQRSGPAGEQNGVSSQGPPPRLSVDSGLVSISLAAGGISAAVAAASNHTLVRALAAIAFILSVVSAFEFYWAYMAFRVPELIAGTYGAGQRGLRGLGRLIRRWLTLLRASLTGGELVSPQDTLAMGLLNLLFALLLIVAVVSATIAMSFLE